MSICPFGVLLAFVCPFLDPSHETQSPLDRLIAVERASRYSIISDGRVKIDDECVARRGSVVVRRGTLRPEGIKVAIKTPRGGIGNKVRDIKPAIRETHTWSKFCHEGVLPIIGNTEFDFTVSIVSA
ncbi:hypothetical protein ID866_8952 [Astraeus odoratus]|nr:hypothetical protein ID866_8952 [Astraeus odoratus]